jgi:hypothetical protein
MSIVGIPGQFNSGSGELGYARESVKITEDIVSLGKRFMMG